VPPFLKDKACLVKPVPASADADDDTTPSGN
jgi:hypothetical protein